MGASGVIKEHVYCPFFVNDADRRKIQHNVWVAVCVLDKYCKNKAYQQQESKLFKGI